jgi:predicted PurR-regulated permease PerM
VAGIVLVTYLVLINLKNFWLRPYIMGRSVHMNEALIFVAIMMATILYGIMGALLVVPVLASMIVILEYLRRRVLGLPPFDDHDDPQFVDPPQEIKSLRKTSVRAQEKRKKDL